MYTIKTNSSLHAISSMFEDMGRKDNFSLEGIEAIMDYLEETSADGAIDLDVIAICCDFTELTGEEALEEFDLYGEDYQDGDLVLTGSIVHYIQQYTWAIELDNGNLLYINF